MRRTPAFVAAMPLLLILTACSGGTDVDPETDIAPPEVIERGEAVYQSYCAACHGPEGEGQPGWMQRGADGLYPAPPHDSTGHTWHHPDDLLIEIVRLGGQAVYGSATSPSGMPAFGHALSDGEIEAVIAYIKTFWDEEERAFQAQLNEPG